MEQILPKGKYPAKAHCKKVVEHLKSSLPKDELPSILYLQGQSTRMQEDNDEPQPFRSATDHNPFWLEADWGLSDNAVILCTSPAAPSPTAI